MNKFKLKLSALEIMSLQNYIASTLSVKPRTVEDKLLSALMIELVYKLQIAVMMTKREYRVTISYATGLALLLYFGKHPISNDAQAVLVQKVIGFIDQKTV